MSHASMHIGFAVNWLLVRIGQPVSTGPGGRLAVIRRLRLAPIGVAIGLVRHAQPSSRFTMPSSRGLMKHPG
jgi:hypothetical protein